MGIEKNFLADGAEFVNISIGSPYPEGQAGDLALTDLTAKGTGEI